MLCLGAFEDLLVGEVGGPAVGGVERAVGVDREPATSRAVGNGHDKVRTTLRGTGIGHELFHPATRGRRSTG